MDKRRRRLTKIEVNLTPEQIVLLWMKKSLSRPLDDAALQCPPPREAIAKSVVRVVREALKGEPTTVVERAILQARREADWLYMIVVQINYRVKTQLDSSQRECAFLAGWLYTALQCSSFSLCSDGILETVGVLHRALSIPEELLQTMRSDLPTISWESLQKTTLAFLQSILLLEATLSRISAERFGGHPILFSDSMEKLNKQLALVDEVLGYYNLLAREAHFAELTRDSISDSLGPLVDRKMSDIVLVAKAEMLAQQGEKVELRAIFAELVRDQSLPHQPTHS
jgi:hypothetical protein